MLRIRVFRALGAALLIIAAAGAASAHEYHTSLTRIDLNSERGVAEITVRVFVHDLGPLLEREAGKRLDLDGKAADAVIFDLVKRDLALKVSGNEVPLKWIGKEAETRYLFAYLEAPVGVGPFKLAVRNTLFFDRFKQQTNYVIVRSGKAKSSLLYTSGDLFKDVVFPAAGG